MSINTISNIQQFFPGTEELETIQKEVIKKLFSHQGIIVQNEDQFENIKFLSEDVNHLFVKIITKKGVKGWHFSLDEEKSQLKITGIEQISTTEVKIVDPKVINFSRLSELDGPSTSSDSIPKYAFIASLIKGKIVSTQEIEPSFEIDDRIKEFFSERTTCLTGTPFAHLLDDLPTENQKQIEGFLKGFPKKFNDPMRKFLNELPTDIKIYAGLKRMIEGGYAFFSKNTELQNLLENDEILKEKIDKCELAIRDLLVGNPGINKLIFFPSSRTSEEVNKDIQSLAPSNQVLEYLNSLPLVARNVFVTILKGASQTKAQAYFEAFPTDPEVYKLIKGKTDEIFEIYHGFLDVQEVIAEHTHEVILSGLRLFGRLINSDLTEKYTQIQKDRANIKPTVDRLIHETANLERRTNLVSKREKAVKMKNDRLNYVNAALIALSLVTSSFAIYMAMNQDQ